MLATLVAASAFSLAAAIALSGFSALAAGSAYLVRMNGTRLDFHSSYFALKQPQSFLQASFSSLAWSKYVSMKKRTSENLSCAIDLGLQL
jgi:hypothetical protein